MRWVLGHDRLFLTTSSDATLLRHALGAAAPPAPVPSEAEMQADVDAHRIQPLFDGDALERI